MRGHLAVFAEILSSNQLLWDSFSSLEKYSKALEHTIECHNGYRLVVEQVFTQH